MTSLTGVGIPWPAAADASMPAGRYLRWINTHIMSAVLERVRDEDGEPLFTVKGGAAMELRLGINARAAKDYDAAFRDRAEGMLDALDAPTVISPSASSWTRRRTRTG